jgi:uncharacterized iron-regulated membrane protein
VASSSFLERFVDSPTTLPIRKWIFRAHLLLGALLGLYALFMGLTGAILVYRDEITRALRPELHAPAPANAVTPDHVLAVVTAAYPGKRPLSVTWPNSESGAWMVFLLSESGSLQVYVDPASGSIRGAYQRNSGWLGWIEQLHFNLLAHQKGRLWNGWAALVMFFLSLSGAMLWWPGRFRWRMAVTGRSGATGRARAREWHGRAGILTFVFLAGLAFTGAYFTWPALYIDNVKRLFPSTRRGAIAKVAPSGQRRPITELAAAARAVMGGRPIHRAQIPARPADAMRIIFRDGHPHEFHRTSNVILDPYSARVLATDLLSERSFGDRLISWFSAFHFGIWGGPLVRALWIIVGLAVALLGLTSLRLWLPRLTSLLRRGSAGR